MTWQSFYKIKKYYIKYVSWVIEISEAHLSRSVMRNPNKLLYSDGKFPLSCAETHKTEFTFCRKVRHRESGKEEGEGTVHTLVLP